MLKHRYRQLRKSFQAFKNQLGIYLLGGGQRGRELELRPDMKILILRYDDKIGDMIVNTFMLREIKKTYPKSQLDVVAGARNMSILDGNINVRRTYIYRRDFLNIWQLGRKLQRKEYDLLIELSDKISWRVLFFVRLIGAKFNLGLKRQHISLFDESIENKNTPLQHITKRYASVLKRLGIRQVTDFSYDLQIHTDAIKRIGSLASFQKNQGQKLILFNRFGASKHRTISSKKSQKVLELLLAEDPNIQILLLTPPRMSNETLSSQFSEKRVTIVRTPQFDDLVAVARLSDLIITPDTAVVHIAEALQKKLIGIYLNQEKIKQWGALSTRHENLLAKQQDETDTFSTQELLQAFRNLIDQ